MTQHTPGPWRIGDAGNTIFGPKQADGSLAVTIATMGKGAGGTAANAYLIAAAPELLEAIQELLNYTGGWDLTDTDHPIVKARAAIAKAEGGAS